MTDPAEGADTASTEEAPFDAPDLPPFSWRREWLFALVAPIVALLHRIPSSRYAEMVWNGDGSLVCLMARHHSQGWFAGPAYFYGQSYNGTIEAWFAGFFYPGTVIAETFYPGLPAGQDIATMGYAQAWMSAITLFALYRLCYAVGGRWGAVLGLLPGALGPMALFDDLCGHQHSYQILRLQGTLLVIIGIPYVIRPTNGRVAVLGALLGISLFNSPQIISFLVPLLMFFYLRGQTAALWNAGALPRALGPFRWRWLLRTLGLLVAAGVTCAALSLSGVQLENRLVSITKPWKYMKFVVLGFGLTVLLVELIVNRQKRQWVVPGLCFAGGFAIGNLPNLIYKIRAALLGIEVPRGAATGISFEHLAGHARDLVRWGGYTLFNSNNTPWIPKEGPYFWLMSYVLVFTALACAIWLARHANALLDLARLRYRPPTVSLILGLQAMIALALWMVYPRHDMYARYLLALWVPFSALLAGSYLALRRRVGPVAAALPLVVMVGYYAWATILNIEYIADKYPEGNQALELRGVNRAVLRARPDVGIAAGEVDAGVANYWYGYRMSYLARERVVFRAWPRRNDARGGFGEPSDLYEGFVERVEANLKARKPVAYVFNLTESFGSDYDRRSYLAFWRNVRGGRRLLLARDYVPVFQREIWSFGDFWVFVVRIPDGRMVIENPVDPALVTRVRELCEQHAVSGIYARYWQLGYRLGQAMGDPDAPIANRERTWPTAADRAQGLKDPRPFRVIAWPQEQTDRRWHFRRPPQERAPRKVAYLFDLADIVDIQQLQRIRALDGDMLTIDAVTDLPGGARGYRLIVATWPQARLR